MPNDSHRTRSVFAACLVYTLLLLWGSLYPLNSWQAEAETFGFLVVWRYSALSVPDLVVNALIYIPLGIGLRQVTSRWPVLPSVLFATACAAALSFGVEAAQAHLPQRVPSLADFALNTTGGFVGAVLASMFTARWKPVALLMDWRARTFTATPEADLAVAALIAWVLAQLTPFVPAFDLGSLRSGLAPLAATLNDPATFIPAQALGSALEVFALVLLARDARNRPVSLTRLFWLLAFAVMMLKVVVISRQLSAEMIVGTTAGLILGFGWPRRLKPMRPVLAALAVTLALVISELTPSPGALRHLNWTPFVAHMSNPMLGLSVLIDSVWPYLILAAALVALSNRGRFPALVIILACGGLSFALEWMQQHIPGRTPDITTVAMALLTALLAVRHVRPAAAASAPPASSKRGSRLAGTLVAAALLGSATAVWSLARTPPPTVIAAARSKVVLPAPEDLRVPELPGFRQAHPRLPYPSPADVARLKAENPEYVRQLVLRAQGGKGDLSASLVAAVLAPETQDVRAIVERVLRLRPAWRGHEQTKPIAQTYDWLHDRIPADLMPRLKDKVIEACNFQINVIRKEALSPYNVYLYNSPLQALMACALAIHGDDERAAPVMAFTHDFWINRVLPVWRQVGGQNGGWHEGNEYVGIGIGQAIYQVPAMWRSATGEDLFRSEPAIRGFLDFLVYRMLPDGTSMRWGDGRFGRRQVFDADALALEYRHAAAYTLSTRAGEKLQPTSWPWGPLTDRSLYDPEAVRAMPLTHVADGLGLVVARSSWNTDATHFSFKAGNNYWSHSHLDQGAFSLFKGAPLAIDSGCYCGYGGDHHLNYQYQTIAHNTITVTDPADFVQMPVRQGKPPRTIANDGGQRRVGSAWNLHAAPADLEDWQSKLRDFHTGRLVRVVEQDGLLVALTDITAAYTNSESGVHSFHHRSRRVEKAWRIFVYDRVSDIVIIHDTVEATRADFVKRWLLHSAFQPRIDGRKFTLERPATATVTGLPQLQGEVIFPRDARLVTIGGPGFEYFVDGMNFDENGTLAANIARGPSELDPGAWRLEIMPQLPAIEDRFLVVLRPGLSELPALDIRPMETPESMGAEIHLPGRMLRLAFPRDRLAVDVMLTWADGIPRTLTVDGAGERAPALGWVDQLRSWMTR
jgi:VanZ family protein